MAVLILGDILDADAGIGLAQRQDHGRVPALDVARHPRIGQRLTPLRFGRQFRYAQQGQRRGFRWFNHD